MERNFFTILDQALARLHSHGRVTYKTLQLQFHLDDAYLEARCRCGRLLQPVADAIRQTGMCSLRF